MFGSVKPSPAALIRAAFGFFESPAAKKPPPGWVVAFLVIRRRFELRTHCLKGSCSAN